MKAKPGTGHMPGAPRPFFRWTFRWAGSRLRRAVLAMLGGCLLGPLGLTGPAYAQAPTAAQAMPSKSYMNKSTAILPIQIDPRLRSNLREVQLYVKSPGLKDWVRHDMAPPDQKEFVFRSPKDGEYWFTVVTVDKNGRLNPSDLRNVVPGVIVVVDTQAPEPDLRSLPDTAEGHCVQCVSRDANPDPTRTRFEYQTGDQKWRGLDPMANQSDIFCIPQQAVLTGMVRVTMADRCGNTVTRELNLNSCGGAVSAGVSTSDVAATKTSVPAGGTVARPNAQETVAALPQRPVSVGQDSSVMTTSKASPPGPMPDVAAVPLGAVPTGGVATVADAQVKQAAGWSNQEGPAMAAVVPAVRKVVNNTRVFLDYKIEQTGPSGVGRVEMYVTKNQAQSWERVGEDEDRQSPAMIELPGEGTFGVKLVVSNGRGFGGTAPTAGDTPDWWIEVDTSKPTAELVSVQSGQSNEPGVVLINWTVRDKNLSSEPIDLLYAQNPEGPWQFIARGLKNESPYRWSVPREVGGQAYVRLMVRDLGGNVTQCETAQAVLLDDWSRPHIRVTGISTSAPPSTTASAPALP